MRTCTSPACECRSANRRRASPAEGEDPLSPVAGDTGGLIALQTRLATRDGSQKAATMSDPTHHLSLAERWEAGREARRRISRSGHADWAPRPDRRDPVASWPRRTSSGSSSWCRSATPRMAVSPFTFYRGSAAVMAEDLGGTTDSGLWVQAGGDAHLSNFGAYASPSRELVFDANDFDETLPGPWEWDLKRLTDQAGGRRAAPRIPRRRRPRKIAAHTVRLSRRDGALRRDARSWTSGTTT